VEATRAVMLEAPPAGVAAALRGMAARADSTGILGDIDVPTLIVCGQQDTLSTVDEMQEIARRIPGSRYVEIPHAGHMSPLENPSEVNQAIRDFLA
jgi:pimeloyl-ACP methyl ester carboxylesterase